MRSSLETFPGHLRCGVIDKADVQAWSFSDGLLTESIFRLFDISHLINSKNKKLYYRDSHAREGDLKMYYAVIF